MTLYLSPTDYHRLHAPCDLRVLERRYIAGTLWPVNTTSVAEVDRLFCVNERVALRCETPCGARVWVVLVGATIVGGIRLAFEPEFASDQGEPSEFRDYRDEPVTLRAGAPLGHFELGSTAVLIWDTKLGEVAPSLDARVRVGEALVH